MKKSLHTGTLPITKKPVASQLASVDLWINLYTWNFSQELKDALGVGDIFKDTNTIPMEMYEVLSVTSHGNAALLLIAGYKSRHEALKYLNENGFSHLVVDSSDTVAQALDRRISVTGYMESEQVLKRGGDYVMDAVEVSASSSLREHKELIEAVRTGDASLSDLKNIGFTLLAEAYEDAVLGLALSLQRPDSKITIEGAKEILKRARWPRRNSIHSGLSLELGVIYGDKVCDVTDPGTALQAHRKLVEAHPELNEDDRYEIVLFMTRLDAYRTFFPHEVPRFTVDDQIALYRTGLSVEEHASNHFRLDGAI